MAAPVYSTRSLAGESATAEFQFISAGNGCRASIRHQDRKLPLTGDIMAFQLKFDDISAEKLIQIPGKLEPFYVCKAGGMPELENAFFYGDSEIQFFFYAHWITNPGRRHDIDIYTSTVARLRGPPPRVHKDHLGVIVENITKLFMERSFHFPARPVKADEVPAHITFNWALENWAR